MDPRIVKFIRKHHVLTLASSRHNIPWTAHCFYAFLEEEKALVFTSDDDTRHAREMLANQVVAGGIALETKVVGKIRGIQLTGRAFKAEKQKSRKAESKRKEEGTMDKNNLQPATRNLQQARRAYLTRFPYAALMKTTLWILEIDTIKFTDNRLGFGKKLHWER